MKELFSLIVAIALLTLFQVTGLIATLSLSHPWWNTDATLTGGSIGIASAVILFWLEKSKPTASKRLALLASILFLICLAATWYFAQKFINAANFEPLAGQMWHKGYITTIALFVPMAAYLIRPLISGKQQ